MFQKIKQLTTLFSKYFLVLVASVLLLDFFFSSEVKTEPIDSVQKKKIKNYRGSGHHAYFVLTSDWQFYTSREFALGLKNHKEITYEISLFFGETNTVYPTQNPTFKEIYSLRWFTGLIVPFIFIMTFFFFEFIFKKPSVLFAIITAVLILDAIYIIVF